MKCLDHDNAKEHTKLNGINTEIKEYRNNLSFWCRQLLCVEDVFLEKVKLLF